MNPQAEVPMVVRRTVDAAVRLLQISGVQYKIIAPWGEFGELVFAKETKPRRKRGPNKYPNGELRSLYLPFIENLKVGEVAQIPLAGYSAKDLQCHVTSYCAHEWGKSSYRSCSTAAHVEVLRTK